MDFVEPIRDKKKIAHIKNQLDGARRYRDLLLLPTCPAYGRRSPSKSATDGAGLQSSPIGESFHSRARQCASKRLARNGDVTGQTINVNGSWNMS